MIKRNKLSIFLLAVVMMLSVYYVNMPDGNVGDIPTGSESVVTRYPYFAESRIKLLEEREMAIAVFEEILGSTESDENEKLTAKASMQELLGYTEKEVLAEKMVIDLGYVDCFISYNNTTDIVDVEILNFVFNDLIYDEVCIMINEIFGTIEDVLIYTNQN